MPESISRRQFLKDSLRLAGAVSIGRVVDLGSISAQSLKKETFPEAVVSQGVDQDTPAAILKTALDALGGINRFVKPGQSVAIKPNATWAFAPHTASSTDPDVLRALIEIVKEAGASKITVMDHCSIEPGTAKALKANLLGAVVEETGVEGLFPDRWMAPKGTYTTIELPEGHSFKKIGVIKAAVDADVRINMGVAKSHSVTRVTLALKHMMGFLETPQGLHAYLHKGIADINTKSPMQAQLHILEALRIRTAYNDYITCGGPETDETHPFMIFRKNQIIAGVNPVLVDAYACSTYYKIKPKELAHLKNASDWGLGDLDLEAATAMGKFRMVNVGEVAAVIPQPTETKVPVEITSNTQEVKATTSPQQVVEAKPSAIPLPTAVESLAGPGVSNPVQQAASSVVNPNSMLNKALIPASIVMVGAGIVATRRKGSSDQAEEESPDEK